MTEPKKPLLDRLRTGVYGLDRIYLCFEAADEIELLINALWKACGDDEDLVKAYIHSQRGGE